MPIPDTTSAKGLERYRAGKALFTSHGEAWREINALIIAQPPAIDTTHIPAVSEPFLVWTTSGEVDFQARVGEGPWITHRIAKGSFILSMGGAPYDVRWNAVTSAPFEVMTVLIELPLIQRAFDELFGADGSHARLRDMTGFTDEALESLMERLRDELIRPQASRLYVQGLAQAIAIHLTRNYAEAVSESGRGGPSLPGYKIRQITHWMAEHFADDLDLDSLAGRARLSKFHFQRLFKRVVGVTPARYQTDLRIDAARRLLRETNRSVVAIALEVGYSNPSYFAQLFRRETGLAPSEYRRQR